MPPTQNPPPPAPLCLTCLKPYNPLQHYCPHCGAPVGQLTPYIPFVNIGWECNFWGRLWKKIWSPDPGGIFTRIIGTLMILMFAPILLVGIPFILLNHHRRRPQRRGFDVLVEAEQKSRPSPPPTSTSAIPPDDSPPQYADRPTNPPRPPPPL